ncbi:MFS transporter [Cohnella candidum]|nr:MFS transporter [Cohnella candidum]
MTLRDRLFGRIAGVPLDPLFAVLFLLEFVRGAFLVSYLPSYAADTLNISASVVGVAVSVHYLADSFAKCLAGYLLDRLPHKPVLIAGLLLGAASLFAMNVTRSPGVLIAASALLGLGGSPVWLACLSRIDAARRGEQMGVLYLFWMAGLGLGPVVTNVLMDISYRGSFSVLLALTVAATLAAALISFAGKRKTIVAAGMEEQLREIRKRLKAMGLLLPGMMIQTMAGSLLVPILSRFAAEQVGLSHAELSVLMVSGGAAAGLGLIPMGKLSDRFGGRWFLVGGFGTFGASVFAVSFARSFGEAELLACLLGLSYAALLPAWNAQLAGYVPESSSGVGWGMVSAVEGIGVVLGPLAGGWLSDRFGLPMPFRVCAVLFALIAAVYVSQGAANDPLPALQVDHR